MMSAESNSKKLVSYQKKDGRVHAHPSVFWYDNDKDLKVCFLVMCIIYLVLLLVERCQSHRESIRPPEIASDSGWKENVDGVMSSK